MTTNSTRLKNMKTLVSLSEIASALGLTDRGALKRSVKEAWPFEDVAGKGRGGKKRVYRYDGLAHDVQLKLQLEWCKGANGESVECKALLAMDGNGKDKFPHLNPLHEGEGAAALVPPGQCCRNRFREHPSPLKRWCR